MSDHTDVIDDEEKLLSGFVPKDVYWDFKQAAANRKERMKEAILHAAMLYISVEPTGEESDNNAR